MVAPDFKLPKIQSDPNVGAAVLAVTVPLNVKYSKVGEKLDGLSIFHNALGSNDVIIPSIVRLVSGQVITYSASGGL
jgi:hypothetical protein